MTQSRIGALDGMRAIAVTAVVVYHLWPSALPSGFLGVDVFMVVSGFIVTNLLMRERDSTGRIRLGVFWGRRFRRLCACADAVARGRHVLGARDRPGHADPRRSVAGTLGVVLRDELEADLEWRDLRRDARCELAVRAPVVARGGGAVLPVLAVAPRGCAGARTRAARSGDRVHHGGHARSAAWMAWL